MSDAVPDRKPDFFFLLLLAPLAAVSLPSLLFCFLDLVMGAYGALTAGPVVFHLPPENGWDQLFAAQTWMYDWVARWNSAATLGATAVFVFTLLRPRWRPWMGLALIPYGVLLCADFTLRWRAVLLP